MFRAWRLFQPAAITLVSAICNAVSNAYLPRVRSRQKPFIILVKKVRVRMATQFTMYLLAALIFSFSCKVIWGCVFPAKRL